MNQRLAHPANLRIETNRHGECVITYVLTEDLAAAAIRFMIADQYRFGDRENDGPEPTWIYGDCPVSGLMVSASIADENFGCCLSIRIETQHDDDFENLDGTAPSPAFPSSAQMALIAVAFRRILKEI